jgi:hypothetical protein
VYKVRLSETIMSDILQCNSVFSVIHVDHRTAVRSRGFKALC